MQTQFPLLADTLEIILPSSDHRSILQACLSINALAAKGWRTWIENCHADLKEALVRDGSVLKRLMPLLDLAHIEHRIQVDEPTLAVLRAASLWEQQRAQIMQEIVGEAIRGFASAGVVPLLMQGVALAHTVYPKPALRHCHDADFLLPASGLSDAINALERRGFTVGRPLAGRSSTTTLFHATGLPLCLHSELLAPPLVRLPCAAMLDRALEISVSGMNVRTFNPTDSLLLLCGQIASGKRHDLSWVADSVMLLRRPFSKDEWSLLSGAAAQSGLSLSLFVILLYLRKEFGIGIPDNVVVGAASDARRNKAKYRESMLAGLRRSKGLSTMVHRSGWRSRIEIARWLFAPSPPFMQLWCKEKGIPCWPVGYIARPFRGGIIRAGAIITGGRR